jgi:HPt (histidine-containing phosphotransfer) domain-containing protein
MKGRQGNPATPVSAADAASPGTLLTPVLAFEELVDRCMGNLDFAERILRKYQDRFPEDVEQLRRLAESGDATQLAATAHRLKGAAANIGAPRLTAAFAEIESLGRNNELAQIPTHLQRLQPEWDQFQDGVADVLARTRGHETRS